MPNFACSQYGEQAKSIDRRKHLNYLLNDYSEENKRVYGDTMPQSGSLIQPVRAAEEPKRATTALEDKAAESRQLAAMINNRRTPTGQFFADTNFSPTIYEKQSPPATYEGRNPTEAAVHTMRSSGGRQGAEDGQYVSPPFADTFGGGGVTLPPLEGSGKRPSWVLPWQTGDRAAGGTLAASIRHKRTPIGAFANLDLAKVNK
ncbi:hypothetical protein TSOC_006006 [Tetrabaena socialis]|uniref:Uncharacterized protein n=1 Tax=Tetrabaena socialis TaxID=47790 RepID=A0A2J8A4U2_9CHLO|nr:hypothetical protein TSOC_006006 [Tetrabaena socialis]|eukprot:PNH07544.1 hypothetical protein TSOC_006006 [Tetrabaena socialis]